LATVCPPQPWRQIDAQRVNDYSLHDNGAKRSLKTELFDIASCNIKQFSF